MADERIAVRIFGDAALLVAIDDGDLPTRAARSAALAEALQPRLAPADAWGKPVPGIGGVLVPLDPLVLDVDTARGRLADAVRTAGKPVDAPPRGRTIEVPVRYGGSDGPDLDAVATSLGVPAGVLVQWHAAREYDVLVLGFLPGFAYLGPLHGPLAKVGRRAVPRPRVPAGSVAIAGGMTGIYPSASAGGWHLIGRTELRVWEPGHQPPNRLARGDRVRFVPVRTTG